MRRMSNIFIKILFEKLIFFHIYGETLKKCHEKLVEKISNDVLRT